METVMDGSGGRSIREWRRLWVGVGKGVVNKEEIAHFIIH